VRADERCDTLDSLDEMFARHTRGLRRAGVRLTAADFPDLGEPDDL
jgi:hypothetical protein